MSESCMLIISKKQLVYKCTQERTTGRWIFRNSSVAWLLVHFLFRFNISWWITFSYRLSTSITRHNCRKKCQRSFASMDDQVRAQSYQFLNVWCVWEYNLVKNLANAVLFLSWNGPGVLFVWLKMIWLLPMDPTYTFWSLSLVNFKLMLKRK